MEINNKKILVTGGAGAIGKNVVEELIKRGCEVIILDDLSSGHIKNIPKGIKFIQGSILKEKILDSIFKNNINAVIHLAANFANQNSVDNPEKDLLVNGMGTLKILQYSKKHNVKKFVYSSSSCVYGHVEGTISEDIKEYKPDTPYAITKLLGEKYVNFFNKYYKLNTVILRYFNSFGPGEFPGKYRNVIPNFFKGAINNKPLVIYGTGKETRDFNYVKNTVYGTILALEKDESIGETFNIASGRARPIIEVAKKINGLTSNKGRIIHQEKRDWDTIAKRKPSIEKIKRILGYKPLVDFDEGLKLEYEWIKEMSNAGLL